MINKKILTVFGIAAILATIGVCGKTSINLKAEELVSNDDEPRLQSMSFYGDTTSQMGFNWNTTNITDSNLEVVEFEDSNGFASTNVKKFLGSTEKSTVKSDKFIHRAVATGLTPNTKYKYRFGDAELNCWAEEGSFQTSSNTNKDFKFAHISDPQGWEESHYEGYHGTLEAVDKEKPAFIALTGDVVNNSWEDHTPKLEQWEWALTDQWDILKNYPVMPVSGNHDGAKNDFNSRFNLPVPQGSDTSTGSYYSFDYEGVHFMCLNTNDSGHEESNASALRSAQYKWFKADLIEHKDDRFKIVLMHKGLFDAGSHCANQVADAPDYDVVLIREQIAPLCTKYGVDLVLQGHDHLYSETYPTISTSTPNGASYVAEEIETNDVDYEGETIPTYNSPKGTIYLNTGSASGSKFYAVTNYDEEAVHIRKAENLAKRAYTTIEIKGKSLISRTYTINDAGVVNAYTSFAIDKSKENTPSGKDDDDKKGCSGDVGSFSILSVLISISVGSLIFSKKKENN